MHKAEAMLLAATLQGKLCARLEDLIGDSEAPS